MIKLEKKMNSKQSYNFTVGFPGGPAIKNLPAMQEAWVWSLDWEDALEKEMANHSSILACEILWTQEPGRLQSMRLKRARHDLMTKHNIIIVVA